MLLSHQRPAAHSAAASRPPRFRQYHRTRFLASARSKCCALNMRLEKLVVTRAFGRTRCMLMFPEPSRLYGHREDKSFLCVPRPISTQQRSTGSLDWSLSGICVELSLYPLAVYSLQRRPRTVSRLSRKRSAVIHTNSKCLWTLNRVSTLSSSRFQTTCFVLALTREMGSGRPNFSG